MKKFKKLIPALCMLLVSAVLVGTSTYAWFSMNDKVTVTGLEVKAKTDQVYLLISKDNTEADAIQAEKAITVPFNAQSTLRPAAYDAAKATDAVETAKPASWYWEQAKTADNAEGTGTKNYLDNFNEYVWTNSVYITVAKGSKVGGTLSATVKMTATNGDITAARVLLVTSDTTKPLSEFTSANGATAQTIFTGTINDTTVVKVDIYVFIDGEESVITTNNFANLGNASMEITFNIA